MSRVLVMPTDMDAAAMKAQRPVCEEVAASGDDVVVDMSRVEFIDSSGVGAIVFMFKRLASAGRKIELTGVKGQPLQLLTYLRLNDLIVH